jgi:hypothetical protein
MRPLSAVERFFERLFERPSARLFRTRLQPVQILRRVERAMERARRVDRGRVQVPDQFIVRLHPDDLGQLHSADGLPAELASGALAFARGHGYVLAARPTVVLVPDGMGHAGEVDVEARFSAVPGAPGMLAGEAEAGRTRVFEVPVATGPRATLLVHEPGRPARTVVTDGGTLTIGRGESNGLVLADPGASRHHARLAARDGLLVLTDLASTNGTRVNGRSVRELAIGEGDEIRIGDSVLMVAAVDEAHPGRTGHAAPPAQPTVG